MANRKRNIKVEVRLTEEELTHLNNKVEAADFLNRAAYMRKMLLDGYILQLDLSLLLEAKRLLATATNNIKELFILGSHFTTFYPR